MRILMISDFYAPYLGGVEQHVQHLSRELARRNHEVLVVTQCAGGLRRSELDAGVQIHRISLTVQRFKGLFKSTGRTWAPPLPDPMAVREVWRIVRRFQPDVVHGHDWLARSFLPLKSASGSAFVVGLHYFTVSCAKKDLFYNGTACAGPGFWKCQRCVGSHYGWEKGLPVLYGNWMAGVAEVRMVDMFLPVSQAVADGNGLTRHRIPYTVLPNFLPDETGTALPDVAHYVQQLPTNPFILFVGDLRPSKGLDVLLAAYQDGLNLPEMVLIGKAYPETPDRFPPRVRVLHDWPNAAVLEAWRRSLFGVVPSLLTEAFGMVVIEAMAAGRPVVGSRIGGIPEIVRDGETGVLVRPGDVVALREALLQLSTEHALRERLGSAALVHATQFRAGSVVPRYEDVYRYVIGVRRGDG